MEYNAQVQIIPVTPKPQDKRLEIYTRVCSNSVKQLNSLTTQISDLARLKAVNPMRLLADTYIDIASSKTGSFFKYFKRLLSDCMANKMVIVITQKSLRQKFH